MQEKCKDCCSRLFCMSVAEVNEEDFETMANKKDCRKRVFTNADRIRAMSDEELAKLICKHKPIHSWPDGVRKIYFSTRITGVEAWCQWLKQPAKKEE